MTTQESIRICNPIPCGICKVKIEGCRWLCSTCGGDCLCNSCYQKRIHPMDHIFIQIDTTARWGCQKFPSIPNLEMYLSPLHPHPLKGAGNKQFECALGSECKFTCNETECKPIEAGSKTWCSALLTSEETPHNLPLADFDCDAVCALKELDCMYCGHIPKHPVEAVPCGHMMCKHEAPSLNGILPGQTVFCSGVSCRRDGCGQPITAIRESIVAAKVIGLVSIFCPQDLCCASITTGIAFEGIKEHLSLCPGRPIPCRQCGATIIRRDMETHLKNQCPFRWVRCSFCDGELMACRMSEHIRGSLGGTRSCFGMMMCLNSCGAFIRRVDQTDHERLCPKELVCCVLCYRPMPRDSVERHLHQNIVGHSIYNILH